MSLLAGIHEIAGDCVYCDLPLEMHEWEMVPGVGKFRICPDYAPIECGYGHLIWGNAGNIDSGLRKHLEYCEGYNAAHHETETE